MEDKNTIAKDLDKKENYRVISTPVFSLKDRPGKRMKIINLVSSMGFVPETIVIENVMGESHKFVVRAFMPESEFQKQMKKAKESTIKKRDEVQKKK